MPDLEIVKLVLQLGAFGVLAWLVYQQNTKTIPSILKEQTDQINKFLEYLAKMHDQDREDHQKEIRDVVQTQEVIRERIHSMAEAIHQLLGQTHDRDRNSRG